MLIIIVRVTFACNWVLCLKLGLNVEPSDFTRPLISCEETHDVQNLDLGGKRSRLLGNVEMC